jgi:glycosyltransferase involved in cell wall biosynthesis
MTGKLKECNKPLVSILMNCYNGEKYLHEAIESVLAQTYQNWEIIFWDNQSEDRSAEIFKSYIDPRLKYHYAPKHTLLYEARNYALENARGDFIAFLDVDDWWLPDKLKLQIILFDNPDVGFVCSNYFVVNQGKGKCSLAYKKNIPRGRVLDNLLRDYYVGLLTLMVRRSALLYSTMPFDSRYHIIGDFDLVIRLATTYELGVIQDPLAGYRIHGASLSSSQRLRYAIELETWAVEHARHPVIGASKNFRFVAYITSYIRSVDSLLAGKKMEAATIMSEMPWGGPKFRLIIRLLFPVVIFKLIRKYYPA